MRKTPDTYVIIFFVVLVAALLTYIVPQGSFTKKQVSITTKSGEIVQKDVIDPDSFTYTLGEDGKPLRKGIQIFDGSGKGNGFFNYFFEGLVSGSKWGSAVGVIAFILIIGGAFGVILKTGAIEALIHASLRKYSNSAFILIPLLFVIFSLGGAIFGMGESAMAFAMIVVPLMISLGYDSIVAVMITYVATQIGFATSWMNPFSVAIAQSIAGIPVMSGSGFRILMWIFFTSLGIIFTLNYANKIKKAPSKSLVYESDDFFRSDLKNNIAQLKDQKISIGHILVLLTILFCIVWIVIGVTTLDYYLPQMATQFFIMGLVSGIIGVIFKLNNLTINGIAENFKKGASDILSAALIVGMAKGILIVLGGDSSTEPTVINTILYNSSQALSGIPSMISAWFMYLFQSVFNFFIVSGTGQAALTMPILAPLADFVGVTRQVAVLAFQLGDGFTNLIVPTSGALIGALGVARIDWLVWAKFQIKFQVILFIFGSLTVVLGHLIGFN